MAPAAYARRSSLILPVNIRRFVEKAYDRGADAIVLDLEDSVPAQEKASARKLVRDALPLAARGGAEVLVRVNNDPTLLADDIDASVHPGLDGLAIPKAESASQIHDIVAQIDRLERSRGLPPGHLRLSLAIETPRGFLAVEEIARSSDRIATMSIGVEDYCLELGVEPSADGIELLYPVAHLVTVCKVVGVQPTGLVGSIAGFRDLAVFEQAAQRARQLGCEGAGCIHPDQVAVLNRVFTPDPAKVDYARRVVEVFEDGVRRGTASVNLDGRMVDVPVYKRAPTWWRRPSAARPWPSGVAHDVLARGHRYRGHLHRRGSGGRRDRSSAGGQGPHDPGRPRQGLHDCAGARPLGMRGRRARRGGGGACHHGGDQRHHRRQDRACGHAGDARLP